MAIDLPHPWPLLLGWQSARPVGVWVNKPFLCSWQSCVQIEHIERLGKKRFLWYLITADRTMEKPLSVTYGLRMSVPLLAHKDETTASKK